MKIIKKVLSIIAIIILPTFFVTNTNAYIIADATGTPWYYTPQTDFWGVSFDSGSGFIQSVTFDISSFPSAFLSGHEFPPVFDFKGSGNYNNSTAPVIGEMNGLLTSDITSEFTGTNPNIFSFNFGSGSFGAGDYFRFSADANINAAPTDSTGAYFGGGTYFGKDFLGLLFSVEFESGLEISSNFTVGPALKNQSSTTIEVAPVPEPSTIFLFVSGLCGIAALKLKKQT